MSYNLGTFAKFVFYAKANIQLWQQATLKL